MPAQTAAARTRTRARHSTATTTAPRHPRRVSGPLRPLPAAAPAPLRRGTGAFERLRALPEHRAVDGLLRSRAWIWLVGVLLLGIVAMQVSLLKLNAGISRAVTTAGTLERQNAELEAAIGRLSAGDRIRSTALDEGMVMPPAGAVDFLRARPDRDGTLAARRMQPPSDAAAAIMANGGLEPGVPVVAPDPGVTLPPADPVVVEPAVAPAPVDPAAAPVDPAVAPADPAVAAPAEG